MLTTWVLFFILADPAKPGLWVYVENDPHTRSQHVLDALQTPVNELYEISPTPKCQAYLDDLEWSRCDLETVADVHILTRDEAKIVSYQTLPAYAFSPREHPEPLHPQCYLHLQMVPDHLAYITRIRRRSISAPHTWGARFFMGRQVETNLSWLVPKETVRDVSMVIDGMTYTGTETTTEYRLFYEPCPPIDLPIPYTISKRLKRGGEGSDGEVTIRENYHCGINEVNALLKAADMGTGTIYVPSTTEGKK